MIRVFSAWSSQLKNHSEKCRAADPIPHRNGLTHPEILQLKIIKGLLLNRFNNLPASLFAPAQHEQRDICIVFTSNAAGLAAARELEQEIALPAFMLYPCEMRNFLQRFPDTGYKHHIHIWSHLWEDLDSQTMRRARRHPLNVREKYWLHVEGIIFAPQMGRGAEHLWSFDGMRPTLLQRNFRQWAS